MTLENTCKNHNRVASGKGKKGTRLNMCKGKGKGNFYLKLPFFIKNFKKVIELANNSQFWVFKTLILVY